MSKPVPVYSEDNMTITLVAVSNCGLGGWWETDKQEELDRMLNNLDRTLPDAILQLDETERVNWYPIQQRILHVLGADVKKVSYNKRTATFTIKFIKR